MEAVSDISFEPLMLCQSAHIRMVTVLNKGSNTDSPPIDRL